MIRAATTFADPCTGAQRRDFLLGMRRGQPVGAHVPSWCSRHGWTLVAPDELARLASLQLVATRRLRRVQEGTGWTPPDGICVPRWWCWRPRKEASVNQVSTVGLDLAKYVFQLHGADSAVTMACFLGIASISPKSLLDSLG